MSNRRTFLKKASLATAPFILPSHIWAAKGDASPNNRINIAIIGPGKMGRGHAHKLVRNPRAQLTGFAEIADIRTKHTKDLIEKHYSQNTPGDKWKGLKITNDYLELLEDKSLDAVLIPLLPFGRLIRRHKLALQFRLDRGGFNGSRNSSWRRGSGLR